MDLLTRDEAASYLRISLRKLDGLAAKGELRRVKIGQGQRARVLFRKMDLDAFVERNLSADAAQMTQTVSRVLRGRR